MFKKQNGITLIALIVTIIVLLILAGVSISMIAGENGIATKAAASKTKTAESGEKESVSMAVTTAVLEGNGKIETDAEGKIVSDEVKTVLNNELKKIGYEGEEITKLPTKVQMAYNTYLIDKFGNISEYVKKPGKTISDNLDGILTSEFKNLFGGGGNNFPQNIAKIVYKSGTDVITIESGCTDTMGSTILINVDYSKNGEIVNSYVYRGSSSYFEDDGTSPWCHGYPHFKKGWTNKNDIIETCPEGGYIYDNLAENEYPEFEGEWVIDESSSNAYGLQYLTGILVNY